MKNVFVFCGVESTGKTTAIEKIENYLKLSGKKVEVVWEAGRDVCEQSGGVFEMSLLDYEQILFLHQANFLKAYQSECDVVLVDTDSTYTRYYLEKDETLFYSNKKLSEKLIDVSKMISKQNYDKFSEIFYLNPDCPFVQDGTRTYESSRFEDDVILFNLYKKHYKNKVPINVIEGENWNKRVEKIKKIIEKSIKN